MIRTPKKVLGNSALSEFDVLIIGSGAAGSSAAEVLTRFGKKVLILEGGPNYFYGLDDPNSTGTENLFGNDTLKFIGRHMINYDPLVDPRTFRPDEKKTRTAMGDIQGLAKLVGGALAHAGMKFPRFLPHSFRMKTLLSQEIPGANFADWPVKYPELEAFYHYIEHAVGVQGQGGVDPYEGFRSGDYPMKPGMPMYSSLLCAEAAKKMGYHPFPIPAAINSKPYQGRPACIDCGYCSDHGCPTGAKGLPAYTLLRKALLTGSCQLRAETKVLRLLANSTKTEIHGVEAIDPEGKKVTYKADRYILAMSPIESARLVMLSDRDNELGNSSGQVGRNLMFHLESYAIGIFEQRLHNERGRDFTHAMNDFCGDPLRQESHPVGGNVAFDTGMHPMEEAMEYAKNTGARNKILRALMDQSPLRDRFMYIKVIGEDAPVLTNRVDLDPEIRDMYGNPASRITYLNHKFERKARDHYMPKMLDILEKAGAKYGIPAPLEKNQPGRTRHIAGTLRFGTRDQAKTTVCREDGRFHEVGNLYAMDASVFPTFAGFNPTLTIMALATYLAGEMVAPGRASSVLPGS